VPAPNAEARVINCHLAASRASYRDAHSLPSHRRRSALVQILPNSRLDNFELPQQQGNSAG